MQAKKRNGKASKYDPSTPDKSPRITNRDKLLRAGEMVREMIELKLSTRNIASVTFGDSGAISFIAHDKHMGEHPQIAMTEKRYESIHTAYKIVMMISAKQHRLREIALAFNRAMSDANSLSVDLVDEAIKVSEKKAKATQ